MTPEEERRRQFGAIVVRLIRGEEIGRAEARECWRQICAEEQPDLHQGAFIAALRAKPETLEEVVGSFEALYEHDTVKVAIDTPEPTIDNSGTGADTLKTFNISTGASIIAAACGAYVARHASRAVSSNCGAVDVIEALGVDVETPDVVKQSVEQTGIGVFNALSSAFHPKALMRVLSQVRFGSTINLVGPLLHPAMPTPSYKVMGVPSVEAVDPEAQLVRELGYRAAFLMHGLDADRENGMDELSTLGPSHVAELRPNGAIEHSVVTPESLGLRRARYEDIASSRDLHRDALTLLRVIANADAGPRQDVVCLNAAPLLYLTGRAADLREGIGEARAAIRDGRALQKLRDWVTWQNADRQTGPAKLAQMLAQL